MKDTAVAPSRLAALAVEIEATHEAVQGAFRTTLERAAECGRLLIEAKALVGHGNWLPWLEQNTTVGARQSQKYMRLAKGWPEIEANASPDSHLTLSAAAALLAEPKEAPAALAGLPEPGSSWECYWEWAEAQLEGPFNSFDFDGGSRRWLATKLMHKVGLPPTVDIALGMEELRLLRTVPGDELAEALRLMARVVKGEDGPAMDVQGTDLLKAWVDLKITAQRIFVLLWDEVERREKLDHHTWEREANSVLARAMDALDHKRTTLDGLKQRHAAGELSDNEYGNAIIALAA